MTSFSRFQKNLKTFAVTGIICFILTSCFSSDYPDTPADNPTVITTAGVTGIDMPVVLGIPEQTGDVTPVHDNQYEVYDIFWNPPDNPFSIETVYTVTITLRSLEGWAFPQDGIAADGLVFSTGTGVYTINDGVTSGGDSSGNLLLFSIQFKETANSLPAVITTAGVTGIDRPSARNIPEQTGDVLPEHDDQYEVYNISWDPPDNPFSIETVYTVTITLRSLDGYAFPHDGIVANDIIFSLGGGGSNKWYTVSDGVTSGGNVSGNTLQFSIEFDETITVYPDPPRHLRARPADVENGIQLYWLPPGDTQYLNGYYIYRGSERIAQTSATSYLDIFDPAPTPGQVYTYTVRSFNEFDVESSLAISPEAPVAVLNLQQYMKAYYSFSEPTRFYTNSQYYLRDLKGAPSTSYPGPYPYATDAVLTGNFFTSDHNGTASAALLVATAGSVSCQSNLAFGGENCYTISLWVRPDAAGTLLFACDTTGSAILKVNHGNDNQFSVTVGGSTASGSLTLSAGTWRRYIIVINNSAQTISAYYKWASDNNVYPIFSNRIMTSTLVYAERTVMLVPRSNAGLPGITDFIGALDNLIIYSTEVVPTSGIADPSDYR